MKLFGNLDVIVDLHFKKCYIFLPDITEPLFVNIVLMWILIFFVTCCICMLIYIYTVKPVLRGHLWDKEKVGI